MALLKYQSIGIKGIAACVPSSIKKNVDVNGLMDERTLKAAIKQTGIDERRISGDGVCSSDLCYHAAEKLLKDLKIARESIDFLIFVSQSPDFRIPATAIILQNRLKLSTTTAAFDINLGCSGYVYGLSVAYSFASQAKVNRVLLLVGDTVTKFSSPQDKSTALLFGDAGTATLIEKSEKYGNTYFSLNSDGDGANSLIIKGGGYRNPSSQETLLQKEDSSGNRRNDEQLFMDGAEIFNFTIKEIPNDIKTLLQYSEKKIEDIDTLVYHQANKFMLDYLTKKLKFPKEKVVYSIDKFGNTSSASIPVTIVTNFTGTGNCGRNVVLSGFGVGLSWGTALLNLSETTICEIVEV